MKRIVTALVLSVLFLSSGPLAAQNRNTKLLGRFNRYGSYSDVWAFTAKNGKEYALLGVSDRISVIDCSTPSNPVER